MSDAGVALVARCCDVIEIIAARALQKIAAGRRHVAQLLRRAGQDGAGKDRVALLDQWMVGEVGIRHQRADPQPAAGDLLHRLEGQSRDVDQTGRPLHVHLHQINEIGAAGDEFCAWIGGDLAHRVGDVGGPRVLEVNHDCPIACRIAATMFG
jgi:hypothetical protein